MKNIKTIGLAGLAAALLFASCSVEKRHYNKGFHVQWNNKAAKATEQATNNTKPAATTIENTAAINTVADEAAPTLTASTQTQVTAPVAVEKATVSAVTVKKATENPVKVNQTKTETKKSTQAAVKKAKDIANTKGGGTSQLIALLLCIFLGYIGIHRFYLGYIGIGILQIITVGGCGIWALIDLIRIITGDLGPKDGSGYSETL